MKIRQQSHFFKIIKKNSLVNRKSDSHVTSPNRKKSYVRTSSFVSYKKMKVVFFNSISWQYWSVTSSQRSSLLLKGRTYRTYLKFNHFSERSWFNEHYFECKCWRLIQIQYFFKVVTRLNALPRPQIKLKKKEILDWSE